MKLHFLGANRQVTGSRYCLETAESKVMIDCGMFQEREFLSRNWEPNSIAPSECDAMLLTHAHLDHCGLIPKLVANGFHAPIYCTRPTVDLTEVILRDSAKIQEEDAAYKKKRHEREGRKSKYPEKALYGEDDVLKTLPMLSGVPYETVLRVTDDISVVFHDAGHILGSAMLEVTVTENGVTRRVIFSGDIGQSDKPLIRDPSFFESADFVVMESTYGDRNHEDRGDVETQLCDVINETIGRGGNLVIPTFAVERAQELMYYISRLVHADRIPDVKVFLDSPMAVDVTNIFRQYRECFDEEAWELIGSNRSPLQFPGLQLARSTAQSIAINNTKEPCIIMATSGMCTGGRIKHHLRRNLSRPESTILFVGYQAHGTLGRLISDGKQEVRIHGRNYEAKAQISRIYGFSGHADRDALLRWIEHLKQAPREIFLTHGEEEAAMSLAEGIRNEKGWEVSIPEFQQIVDLG
ncbi:MAG: MBL fold metallo-hydrolase [Planctomycetaceae bacterium]|nr:MBL fold metallo-hydrolase [Planctomycetales bacterium]MCB9921424.1 MBL fold metallo-hydrolase [Planctomycetaceae bacterium]